MSRDIVPLTDDVLDVGMKKITLQRFEDGRISILIDGFGLGHTSPQFARLWFPEAQDWIMR